MADNDTTMENPPPDETSYISTYNRIIALKERKVEQVARASKLVNRILTMESRRYKVPVEQVEKCRTNIKNLDAEQRALRDELDAEKKRQSELSTHHHQDLDFYNYSVQLAEKVKLDDEVMERMEHAAQTVEMLARAHNPYFVVSIRSTLMKTWPRFY